ncbi:unnamed protein product [Caenorhabditis bovis]|uniref:Lipoprotein n=1 Tax=Caenorhabditis bovis TaxID=2654633 RepID=A0A8S1F3P8_9PELO|nr:unnamed protein product [Caenorhabditis bovis]
MLVLHKLIVAVVLIFALCACAPLSDTVNVSGSFRVLGENEQVLTNQQFQEIEHPFFQLESVKLARAILEKQYAEEKRRKAQQRQLQ